MRGLRRVEQCLGSRGPVNPRQTHRAAKQITAESFEPLGVFGPNRGRRVDGEAAMPEGGEKLDTFVTQKPLGLRKRRIL